MDRVEYERMHAVEDRMWWYRGLRMLAAGELARALGRSGADGPVLDAGCGTGGMLARLGPGIAGRPTLGLEFDTVAATLAAAKSGRPVTAGSVNEMPLGDGALAGYLSLDVLSHGGVAPERAVREAWRCLKPGAVALFNLPAYGWLLSAHDRRVHNVRRFTLLFPVMLVHRLTERDDAASDVRDFPRWLDALFSAVLAIERAAVLAGVSLPFGGSLMIVARRDG